jgi:ribosomal protein L11 methylase PrmA
MIWDLGCNAGEYSVIALKAGVDTAIGFDSDHGALDAGFRRAREEGLNFMPLYMDMTNPSPSQGWSENERVGLTARGRPGGIIALALIHHLVISRNIPLNYAITWLLRLAPTGIIEFIPKQDPMVQVLLGHREDIFPDYTLDNCLGLIKAGARIINQKTITAAGRTLIWYESAK